MQHAPIPGGPTASDPGSILVWLLGLIAVVITAALGFLGSWLRDKRAERAEDRKLELQRRQREDEADAETHRKQRETLERMAVSTETLPAALTGAIEKVGVQVASGFEALRTDMRKHEDEIRRIYTEETAALVTQIHDALVPAPRSSRPSQPELPPPDPSAPRVVQRRYGPRPQ